MIGISTDDHKTQCDFAREMLVPFEMIADSDGKISRLYDVFWSFLPAVHRVTFLIDEKGAIRGVFQHELRIGKHVDDVLRALRKLKPEP